MTAAATRAFLGGPPLSFRAFRNFRTCPMMQIKLHNSKTRRKEPLMPLDPKNIRMYVCGPTVYDRAHLGNARAVVVFDSLFRLLREVYGAEHVTYARNFTDIDDKINAKSAETGRDIGQITEETIGCIWQIWAPWRRLSPR